MFAKVGNVDKPPRRLPLAQRVEAILVERLIAYVDVKECQRSLFKTALLSSFHFVAYQDGQDNLLIWAAAVRKRARADMAEWQRVFGEGFKAVFARERRGQMVFDDLDGRGVELRAGKVTP